MRNEWFYEPQPPSRFVIQEHLRQSLWRGGLSTSWIDVEQAEPPHRASGRWRDLTFTIEWERARRLTLISSEKSQELREIMEHVLGFAPLASYTQDEQCVVEWWRRPEEREERWKELQQDESLDELERHVPLPRYT